MVSICRRFTVSGENVLLTEGAKRHRGTHHHLSPSQRLLATVPLLPHRLRQRSAKLPSWITLFINPDG